MSDKTVYEPVLEFKTIREMLQKIGDEYASLPAFSCIDEGKIVGKTYSELMIDARKTGSYLTVEDKPGRHIGLLGLTSYPWMVGWFGATSSGNMAVPLDRMLTPDEIAGLVKQADIDILLYDKAHLKVKERVAELIPDLKAICLDADQDGEESLMTIISKIPENVKYTHEVTPETEAEIVFTSGTTGKYKGCVITHQALCVNAINGQRVVHFEPGERTMSILPAHHTFEMSAGILSPLSFGVDICVNDNLRNIRKNLKMYKPHCMIAVPMVVEKLYKSIWVTAAKSGEDKKLKAGIKVCKAYRFFGIHRERKLFEPIIRRLGGNLRTMVVGGAHLDPQLVRDFGIFGIKIVQGYGATECAPIIACNTELKLKAESVGRAVHGNQIKTVDGEFWIKGPIVMKGYYKDPESTAEVLEDGWYKTGDLGHIDSEGFLYITGRKKNLIILTNGENVSPEELEEKIIKLGGVQEVVVSAEKNALSAEIYPEEGLTKDEIEQRIAKLNATQPNFKKIAHIVMRDEPFPKTSTQKVKRNYDKN